MPTIFERIENALQGNAANGQIGDQAGALGKVASTLTGLIAHPPGSIQDLGQSLQAVSLPNLDLGGNFASTLTSLKGAVPTSLDSVTGALTSGLTQLQGSVTGDISGKLDEIVQAIQALHQITQLDFTGKASAGGSGGPAPAPGGGGAGGGATPPPPPPQPAQPPPSAAAIDQANTLLASLPSPLNVEGLITSLQQLLAQAKLDNLPVRQLLFFGELRDTLETLFRWKGSQPADIAAELASTLGKLEAFLHGALDPVFNTVSSDSVNAAAHLHAAEVKQIADGLVTRLGELQTAVGSGSLAGADQSIGAASALLDQYDALKPTLQTELFGNLAPIEAHLRSLADDLDAQMGRVVSVLLPSNTLAILDVIPAPPAGAPLPQPLADLDRFLKAIVSWFQDLLDKIDLSAVQQPLKDAADAARSAVDALDSAMVTVTTEVQNLFGQVESLLDQVDTAAIANQVQTAISDFKTQLIQQLTSLFAPVKDALAQVVSEIDQNVSAFDPSQIVGALRDALDSLTNVLKDPAVLNAVQEIQDTLHQAAQQLETFSFAPLTDEVIQEINKIADQLRAIDTSQLNPALQLALQGALAIIPHDLTPLTNPLIDDLNKLIQTGPVPLLDSVKDQPKKLLDQAKSFQPANLLGDTISKPYQQLLTQMDAFRPTKLLAPVDAELASLKDRLKRNASPGLAIKPLEAPFNDLLAAFDQLKPEDVTKPLDDAVHTIIDTVLHAIPIDEFLNQADAVFQKIRDVLATGASFATLLAKAHDLLAGLEDPQSQLEAFVTPILDKLDNLGDTTSLAAALTTISADIGALKAAAVTARFNSSVAPLQSGLGDLNAQGRLTAVVQAFRAIPPASVTGLPDSAEKTAIQSLLTRLDPLQPAFQAPFQSLAALQQALAQGGASLTIGIADWDSRYHAPESALASLLNLSPTPANLKQWVHDAAEEQVVRPLATFFGLAAPLAQVLDPVVTQLNALVTAVTSKLNDLLLGPNSFGGALDALHALVSRLQNFNFNFLRDNLADLFARIRGKLDAFNPARLEQTLGQAFSDMLDTLSLAAVLPADETAALDNDYAQIIDKLKQLDPKKLVIEVVQPEFDQKVAPLLDAFDLTEVLNALIDALKKLGDQLKSEMDRVNQAFQAMLQSVPSGGSLADVAGAVVGDVAGSLGLSL